MTGEWLKTRKATAIFAIIALVSGFLFLNKTMTGGAVLGNETIFDLLTMVGLLLVICAVVLGIYSVKKKK